MPVSADTGDDLVSVRFLDRPQLQHMKRKNSEIISSFKLSFY